MKKFTKVKIINYRDDFFGREGVIIGVHRATQFPYIVVFGANRDGNAITGIYSINDFEVRR